MSVGIAALVATACGPKEHPQGGAAYDEVDGLTVLTDAASRFDPNRVYLWGTIEKGSCLGGAITELAKPKTYAVGFECNATSPVLRGNRLLYQDPDRDNGVFQFVADDSTTADPAQYTYPSTPGANDVAVSARCPMENGVSKGPVSFVVGPGGALLYACLETLRGNANHWYDATGAEVFYHASYDIIAAGSGDLVLLGPVGTRKVWATLDLNADKIPEAGWRVPAAGWSNLGSVYAVRSNAQGFHLALSPPGATTMELWQIDANNAATKIGEYAAAPFDDIAYGVLGSDDAFYSYANLNGVDIINSHGDVTGINRRRTDGSSTVVYDQTGNPVQLPTRMFTGP